MSFFCEIRDERGRLNYVTDECQTVDQVVTWYRKHNVPFDKVVFDGRQSYSFLERPKELLLDRSEVFPRGIPRKGYYISVACNIPDAQSGDGLTAYNLCHMPANGPARLVHKITVKTISMMARAA